MVEHTASVKHRITPMDDNGWSSTVATFRDYLETCNQALAVSRNSYKDDKSDHKDRARHKEQKSPTQVSSSQYQAKFVYLLPKGAGKPASEKSPYRRYSAPLWTTVGDAA